MSTTAKSFLYDRQVNEHSQNDDGMLFVIAKLLERCESEGYSSTGSFVRDLHAICGTTKGNCDAIDRVAHMLGARYDV